MNAAKKEQRLIALVAAKVQGTASCMGCQFLFFRDTKALGGWPITTEGHCALGKNPQLISAPLIEYDTWRDGLATWPPVHQQRCIAYEPVLPRDYGPIQLCLPMEMQKHAISFWSGGTSRAKRIIHRYCRAKGFI